MVGEPKDAEEQVRVRLTEFEKFLIRVWKQGAGGKLGLVLIYLAYGLPFMFNVVVIIVVSLTIWPLTADVTEKLAVLGVLVLVLNAVAYQIRGVAESVLTVMFLTRRRRRR